MAQSQDIEIWRVKILHFCLKTKWPLYFFLTLLPTRFPHDLLLPSLQNQQEVDTCSDDSHSFIGYSLPLNQTIECKNLCVFPIYFCTIHFDKNILLHDLFSICIRSECVYSPVYSNYAISFCLRVSSGYSLIQTEILQGAFLSKYSKVNKKLLTTALTRTELEKSEVKVTFKCTSCRHSKADWLPWSKSRIYHYLLKRIRRYNCNSTH